MAPADSSGFACHEYPARVSLPDSPVFAAARSVVQCLRQAGFETWIIGGSVRDLAMGRHPREFDVATAATPDDVARLFDRTIPVGVQFGVVIVHVSDFEFEVATFRADGGYSDGRRPDSVRFTGLEEDVRRRDFTMNGLALDPESGEIIDLIGGLADIGSRMIRAIGDPAARFEEDLLRPLRAVRFAAVTGFRIDPATFDAVRESAPFVNKVSAERISEEFRKLLEAPSPGTGIRLALDSGILEHVLPELFTDGASTVMPGLIDRLAGSETDLMWASLLYPLGPDMAAGVLRRLKNSNRRIEAVSSIIDICGQARKLPFDDIAENKRLIRTPLFESGLRLLEALLAESASDPAPAVAARRMLAEWTNHDLHPPPLISGVEVLGEGVERGPAIAAALNEIENEQLRGRLKDRKGALELVRKLADARNPT